MSTLRIVAISGSSRAGSLNSRLLDHAVAELTAAGATVERIDLRALEMPLYDGDLEAATGRPAGAERLRQSILGADGLVIASPEYNSSVPPLLKNAIDWVSRPPAPQAFSGKVAALLGASPGPGGTMRAQPHLRQILSALGVLVLPSQVTIARATTVLLETGIADAGTAKALGAAMRELVDEAQARALLAASRG